VLCQDVDGSGVVLEQQLELGELLKCMMACDSTKRISASEAMAHPYFVKHSGNDLEGVLAQAGEGPCLSG
jgi:hypothetical protein